MSFHLSAVDIRLDDGHILRARLGNGEGEQVDAEFDLNTVIGNNDGNFEWGGSDFSGSAEEISFSLEGDDSVPILRANLRDVEGNLQHRDLNLSERITNENGNFAYTE
ncbi:Cyanovirin-N [Rhypophila decipiens]|uniref:Cyanovirin-N n=1 Tax=Rhypophila decipiens TaxID=261697 RepID=A0AAN6Y5G2_9PEZI|nr:Cyanovirin-N [Rhypophila decipiens]